MNILLRMLANPPFESYVLTRRPSLAELTQDMRAQPELAHNFGADQYFEVSDLSAELEVNLLAQRAQFILLSVNEWQQLVADIPREEPPANYRGLWVASRRVADHMILLPEDGNGEPSLMLYAPEYEEERVSLEIARAAAPYSTVEQVRKPCREDYKLEQGILVPDCANKDCAGGCSLQKWIEDDVR